MKAVAFAPGHISGFFEPIFKGNDTDRSGSRGSGMSISLGATSEVTIEPTTGQRIEVYLNKKPSPAPVTSMAISQLIRNAQFHIHVDTTLDLPISQGFGMSAAGALSATLALAKILAIPTEHALKATHHAEVLQRTGLGDAIASFYGGIEIRREPGLPPWGMIEHITGNYDVVICVIGEKILTKHVLSDQIKLTNITSYGRLCTKKIIEKPTIENLFSLSQLFAQKTGLLNNKVCEAITAANQYGMASMCMLGNSVFAIGNTNKLCTVLSQFGKTWLCSVDSCGARVIKC